MAVLEKMRKKMGAIITVVIALALLAFIVDVDKIQSIISFFSSKYDVGQIDGKAITAQEYQNRVDYFKKIYELTSGSVSFDEQTTDIINNSAWQEEISERVLIPTFKSAGLSVGDEEIVDMISGVDISPVVVNEAIFRGNNGSFDKEKMAQFLNNVNSDPQYQLYWSFLEKNIINERLFTKYASLIEKSSFVNRLESRNEISENNNAYDIDFIVKPVGFERDTTITVSDNEIKTYYNKINSSSLIQNETRDADLIVLEVLPTEQDKEKAKEEMDRLYAEFTEITDNLELKNFLYQNSDHPYDGEFYKKGDLNKISTILDDFAANSSIGSFLEPQTIDNLYVAAKIMGKTQRPDSVFIKYLPAGMNENVADSLINVLKNGADFESVAKSVFSEEYQQSLTPEQKLGEIGWVTENVIPTFLPKEFRVLFSTKQGEPVKIQTSGNYLVALTSEQSKFIPKTQVAILSKSASPSQETYANVYSEANELVEKGKNQGQAEFIKAAQEKGLHIIPANRISGSQKEIANYQNMREVTRWIFDSKVGDVSDIISVDNNKYYVVATVRDIHPYGVAPLNEVSPQIKSMLEFEKKIEKLAKETEKEIPTPTSLESVAEKLNTSVSSQKGITFSSLLSMQQFDPKFIGYVVAEGLKDNYSIVGPVKGNMGIYYFQIKGKERNAFYTEDDANNKRKNIISNIINSLPQIIVQKAGVIDERYKFY